MKDGKNEEPDLDLDGDVTGDSEDNLGELAWNCVKSLIYLIIIGLSLFGIVEAIMTH